MVAVVYCKDKSERPAPFPNLSVGELSRNILIRNTRREGNRLKIIGVSLRAVRSLPDDAPGIIYPDGCTCIRNPRSPTRTCVHTLITSRIIFIIIKTFKREKKLRGLYDKKGGRNTKTAFIRGGKRKEGAATRRLHLKTRRRPQSNNLYTFTKVCKFGIGGSTP